MREGEDPRRLRGGLVVEDSGLGRATAAARRPRAGFQGDRSRQVSGFFGDASARRPTGEFAVDEASIDASTDALPGACSFSSGDDGTVALPVDSPISSEDGGTETSIDA